MRSRPSAFVIVLVLGVLFAGPAPVRADFAVKDLTTDNFVIDGTDLYYGSRVPLAHDWYGYRLTIWRQSLLGGPRRRITTFRSDIDADNRYRAGGGRIAIQKEWMRGARRMSKVVTYDRFGRDRRVLAAGSVSKLIDTINGPRDCGSAAALYDVSPEGSVAMSSARFTRHSSHCGNKPNVNHWRYVVVGGDGSKRSLYSADIPVKSYAAGQPPVAEVKMNGDFAALMSRTAKLQVKNLASGATTGPFIESPLLAGTRNSIQDFSVSATGALVIDSEDVDDGGTNAVRWADYFPGPPSPDRAVRKSDVSQATLCGDTLLAFDFLGEYGSLIELDPATLVPRRTILTFDNDFNQIAGCDAGQVILARTGNLKVFFRRVTLTV